MTKVIIVDKVLRAQTVTVPYDGPEPICAFQTGYNNVFRFEEQFATWVISNGLGYVATVHHVPRQSHIGAWYHVPEFHRSE